MTASMFDITKITEISVDIAFFHKGANPYRLTKQLAPYYKMRQTISGDNIIVSIGRLEFHVFPFKDDQKEQVDYAIQLLEQDKNGVKAADVFKAAVLELSQNSNISKYMRIGVFKVNKLFLTYKEGFRTTDDRLADKEDRDELLKFCRTWCNAARPAK
jgi:hypothetical protein